MMIVTGLLFCLTFAGETTPVCAPPDQDPLKVWATQSEEMYHRAETSRAWLSWRQRAKAENWLFTVPASNRTTPRAATY